MDPVEPPDRYVRERDPFFVAASNDPEFCRRYDIDTWQRLGAGVAGCVVKIWHKTRRAYVAVKLIHDVSAETQHKIASEVRVADSVVSNSVVRMFGPQESDKLLWIEMEYVEGPTLKAFLDQHRRERKRLPLTEAAGLGLSLADGVQAIHSAGVVHRDLKPQNIILPTAGVAKAKIADFGISRLRDEERSTVTGEWRGTPAYAPPEFFTGKFSSSAPQGPESGDRRQTLLTPEGDIYSFGVVLYEIFTSEYPYPNVDQNDPYQVAIGHIHGVPTPPSRYNPEIPPDVEDLLLRMLSKNPKDRPPVVEVFEVLKHAHNPPRPRVREASTEAPAVSPVASSSSRRPNVRLAVGALGGAALLIAGALALRGPGPAATKTEGAAPVGTTAPTTSPTAAIAPATATPVMAQVAAATSAPAPPASELFKVKMDPDGVILRNESGSSVSGIQITVRDARGTRYQASSDDALSAKAELVMPLVLFDPEIPEGTKLKQVDVAVRRTPTGRKTLTIPLP